MKKITPILFAICTLAMTAGATSRLPLGTVLPPSGPSPEERVREDQAAHYLIEAVLASPDMTFKMPVLAAAFLDTPEWEQRLQQIISREPWVFAKVNFVYLYWKRVTKKDESFMAQMLDFVRVTRLSDSSVDSLVIVDEMLAPKKKEPDQPPEPTAPSGRG